MNLIFAVVEAKKSYSHHKIMLISQLMTPKSIYGCFYVAREARWKYIK